VRRFCRSPIWIFGTALAVLILTATLSLRNWLEFESSHKAEQQSRSVLVSITHLYGLLRDAETGQRGYLLTGDNGYLSVYNRALPEIEGTLKALARTQRSSSQQQLEQSVRSKLDELAQTIRLRGSGDVARALEVVEGGRGRKEMDHFRVLAEQIAAENGEELARQRARVEAAANRLGAVATGGLAVTSLLLLVAILRLIRVQRR